MAPIIAGAFANVLRSCLRLRRVFDRRSRRLAWIDADDGAVLLATREAQTVGEGVGALAEREFGTRRDLHFLVGNVDLDALHVEAERTRHAAQVGFEFFLELLTQPHVIPKEI